MQEELAKANKAARGENVKGEFPVITTERLILRKMVATDSKDMLEYFSDEQVMKFYGLSPFESEQDALDEISWYDQILRQIRESAGLFKQMKVKSSVLADFITGINVITGQKWAMNCPEPIGAKG